MEPQITLYINNIDYIDGQLDRHGLAKLDAEDFVIDGFDIEKKFHTKPLPENFPSCCETHRKTYDNIQEWFDRFPNCCDRHSKLNGKVWFNKKNYNAVPSKVNIQAYYTNEFIIDNLYSDEWYDIITDFLNIILIVLDIQISVDTSTN